MIKKIPPGSGLTVIFQHQETRDRCGAACAAMVLDAIGFKGLKQDALLAEIQSFTTKDSGRDQENWSSSPDGLQNCLNAHSAPDYFFKIYASDNQSSIAKRMVWTIINFKTPCIALVESGIHWVVIYQFFMPGENPTKFKEVHVSKLQSLFIHDPFDPIPAEGAVNYTDWSDNTQNAEDMGFWKNLYVVLCDPDPPGDKKNKNMSSNMKKRSVEESQQPVNDPNFSNAAKPVDLKKMDKPNESKSKASQPLKELNTGIPIIRINKPGPDMGLIDENSARNYSLWHLEHDGFYKPTKFTRMMVNPVPGKTMLVRALDSKDFWYIVPFIESDNQIGGLMRVNAKNARFQEAKIAIYADQPFSLTRFTDKQIMKRLIDKYGSLKGKIVIDPILVWKPCVQSYSRFLPFYKVKMGSRTVYVRIDGEVYARLTQRKRR